MKNSGRNEQTTRGESPRSQRVITNAQSKKFIPKSDTILSVRHYNSQQDQKNGLNSSTNQNSQIIRSQSPGGSIYHTHTHQQGQYGSGYEVFKKGGK